jgi:hypothetical protein
MLQEYELERLCEDRVLAYFKIIHNHIISLDNTQLRS